MIKIAVFHDWNLFDENVKRSKEVVDEFIKNKDIVDIKYSVAENGDNFMVIYKESQND